MKSDSQKIKNPSIGDRIANGVSLDYAFAHVSTKTRVGIVDIPDDLLYIYDLIHIFHFVS